MEHDTCASGDGTGWSIINSSAANSQLAGVLAAVIFSGIVILFARRGQRSTQALALFAVTFVVLGFDSYLFGTVNGLTLGSYCARAWSEGMAAAGMLGVGGFAAITGISWLMADHTDRSVVDRNHQVLASLSRYMILGVAGGVSLLLTMTSLDYLQVMYDGDVPMALTVATWSVPFLVLMTALALTAGRKILRKRWNSRPAAASDRPFDIAVYGLLTYGLVGPVTAGMMMAQPDSIWLAPDQRFIIGISLVVGLALPGLLIVAVVLATPDIVPALKGDRSDNAVAKPATSSQVLQPLNRVRLLGRSADIFPQGYLMNISIIQGVALSVVVVQAVENMKSVDMAGAPQSLSLSLLSLAGLIIVSYEYLWFSTIMRWVPTFRDTAIPVLLGVAEIVPPLLLGSLFGWWIATAAFALVGGAAFLNTVTRLRPEMFPDQHPSFASVRRLLHELTAQCAVIAAGAVVVAVLVKRDVGHVTALSTAVALTVALPGAALMIGRSEAVLNNLYRAYDIDRRTPVFAQIHASMSGRSGKESRAGKFRRVDERGARRIRHRLRPHPEQVR